MVPSAISSTVPGPTFFIVFADLKTEEDVDADTGPTVFIVETATRGVTTSLPSRMNGHEVSPVAFIDFADVDVPQTALLGAPGIGIRLALRGINHARTRVAATAVGQDTLMNVLKLRSARVDGRPTKSPTVWAGRFRRSPARPTASTVAPLI